MTAPHADVFEIFYRHTDTFVPAQQLIHQALLHLVQENITLQSARVYLRSQNALVRYTGTDDKTVEMLNLQQETDYARVLSEKQAFKGQQSGVPVLILPLVTINDVSGVLQLNFTADADIDVQGWVAAGRQFALVMENYQLNAIMHKQLKTLTALKNSQSFRDVASILASYLLDAEQFVSINYYEHGSNNQQGIRVIASANRRESYEPDEFHITDATFVQRHRQILEAQGDYLYANLDNRAIPDATRAWLAEKGVYSSYHVLLQSSGVVYGFIAYNDRHEDIILSIAERRAHRSIADEVAVILENQHLQQQRENALQETRMLYQISNSLMHIQDIPGLLRNLKKGPGRDSDDIVLLEMGYDDNKHLQTIEALYHIHEDDIAPIKHSLHMMLTADQLHLLDHNWQKQRQNLEIINDITDAPLDAALLQGFLGKDSSGSILTIPVFETGHRMQQLSFIWHSENSIDERLQRLIEAIQAQVIVVLKNQQYRNRIIEAVAESRQQVEMLQQLNTFSQEIQTELQVERIMAQILEHGQRILPFDYLSMQAYYPESGLHEILLFHNDESTIHTGDVPVDIKANEITQRVWADHDSVSIDDLSIETRKHTVPSNIHSLVSSPVLAAGILRGILTIGHKQPSQYSALDIVAAEQMSGQIGVALANADTVARTQKVARNKALAGEISTRLQQQPDLERMADITIQRLGKALGAKRARIRLGVDISTGEPLHNEGTET